MPAAWVAAAWRAVSNGSRSKMIRMWVIRPSATVTHSAPGACGTGRVAVSYTTTAVVSSPNAARNWVPVTIPVNGSMKPRNASAPVSCPAGASQTMSGSM